jgi:putative flippase GtrA
LEIKIQFLRFVHVGLLNTLIGYSVILLAEFFLQLGSLASNALGYMVGGLASYMLNKNYTFRNTDNHRSTLPRFIAVVLTSYLVNVLLLQTAILIGAGTVIAQASAVLSYMLTSYALMHNAVFKATEERDCDDS